MLKIFEMFSGYGGASFALKRLGIQFECVGYSEIDKYAIQCYDQNHKNDIGIYDNYNNSLKEDGCVGTLGSKCGSSTNAGSFSIIGEPKIKNFGDCTKINPEELSDFDLLCGGFPCQAFSIAGKNLGEQDTRGTLFHEIIRIAEVKKPRYMLLENVKGLTFKKHKATFEKILSELDRIGYSVHWEVLNSKEYGIPQNRERIFFVCFRDSEDWENYKGFPEKEELKIFVKDILEEEVDEKYILSKKAIERMRKNGFRGLKEDIASTVTTENYKLGRGSNIIGLDNKDIGNVNILQRPHGYNPGGLKDGKICPSITTSQWQDNNYLVVSKEYIDLSKKTRDVGVALDTASQIALEKDEPQQLDIYHLKHGEMRPLSTYIPQNSKVHRCLQAGEPKELLIVPEFKNKRILKILDSPVNKTNLTYELTGDTPSGISRQGDRIFNLNSYCPTLNCTQKEYMFSNPNGLTIRKLTPKECFRLMGFLDDGINLDGLSDTQKYKLAGNGWEINLVSKILKNILDSSTNRIGGEVN